MKKTVLLISILLALCASTKGQSSEISKGMSTGFQLNQYQNDFGIGMQLTSAYFLYEKVAVRLRGNMMFNEYVTAGETEWSPYVNISLGLIGAGGEISQRIRLYGEGGVIAILPSSDFSSDEMVVGGYGLFGFEFYMSEESNYFIELGGIGTGAVADKVEDQPIYSNGFLISTGFRIHFQ